MTRTPVRSTLTAACVALLLAVLTACTSSGGGTTTRGASGAKTSTTSGTAGGSGDVSPSATTPTSAAAPTIVQHPLPPARAIANSVPKRRFVVLTGCAATADGWQASGTARNATKKPVRYDITVFFTTKGATVMDFARTAVTVPAGRSAPWRAAARFTGPRTTLCVLRGVG